MGRGDTLWLLSTDNLNRPANELNPLLQIIEEAVASLADEQRWRLHPVGALDLLPSPTPGSPRATGWRCCATTAGSSRC